MDLIQFDFTGQAPAEQEAAVLQVSPEEETASPEYDFSGQADDPHASQAEIREYEPDFFERVSHLFRDPAAEKARAVQAIVDSGIYGVSPSVAFSARSGLEKDKAGSVERANLDMFLKHGLDPHLPLEEAGRQIFQKTQEFRETARQSPGTSKFLLDNGIVEHQEHREELAATESIFRKYFVDPAKATARIAPRSVYLLGKFANDATSLAAGTLDVLAGQVENLTGLERGGGFGWLRDWAARQSAAQGQALQTGAIVGTPEDIRGKRLFENPDLLLDPEWLVTNVGDTAASLLPVLAAAYATGGSTAVGGLVGGFMEAGGFYNEQQTGEDPIQGEENQVNAALIYGLASSYLNRIGLDSILGGKVSEAARKRVINYTTTRLINSVAAGGVEAFTEWAEEPTQGIIEALAKEGIPTTGEEAGGILEKVKEAAKNVDVIPGSFLLGGGTSFLSQPPTRQEKADQARKDHEFLQQLHKTAETSSLKAADPEKFGKAVASITRESSGAVEGVFIPARTLQRVIPEESSRETVAALGLNENQVRRAAETGEDVLIPLDKYASVVSGTELAQVLDREGRLRISGLSFKEAQALDPEGDAFEVSEEELQAAQERPEASSVPEADLDAIIGDEAQEGALLDRLLQDAGYEAPAPARPVVDIVKDLNSALGETGAVGTGFNPEKVTPLIVELGNTLWTEGVRTVEAFTARVKEAAGQAWETIKDIVLRAWEQVKKFNESLGEVGAVGKDVSGVKTTIRRTTGQSLTEEQYAERDGLRRVLQRSASAARTAMRVGSKEGVAREKARMQVVLSRARDRNLARQEVKNLKGQIIRALQQTTVKKQSGKPKGRFGATRQVVLDRLRWAISLNREQAEVAIIDNLEKLQDAIPPYETALENKVLSVAAGHLDSRAEQLRGILEELKSFKSAGVFEQDSKRMDRISRAEYFRDQLIDAIPRAEELLRTAETVGEDAATDTSTKARLLKAVAAGEAEFTGWKGLMDIISQFSGSPAFESEISKYTEVLDQENAEKKGNRLAMEQLQQTFKRIYGLKSDRDLVKRMREDSVVHDLGTFETIYFSDGSQRTVTLKLSRAQARKRIMELLDTTLHGTFFAPEGKMGWTPDMVQAIREFLTPQDREFVRHQLQFYRNYYDGVNKVYSDIFGVNLPKNETYSPIKREGVGSDAADQLGDFFQEMPFRATVTSGSLKSRQSNYHSIKLQSDIEVLQRHVTEMEHFKAWAHKVRDLNALFGNQEVRRVIRMTFGSRVMALIEKHKADMAFNGFRNAETVYWLHKWMGNYTRAVLAIKPSIYIKQLTSFVAYADSIPVKDFTAGFADFWKNPKAAIETLYTSELMKDRKNSMDRDIKYAVQQDKYNQWREDPSINNALMLNVQYGDRGAIYAGGWAVYKYHLNQGKSHEEAIRAFESVTQSTQQSGDISELSFWQRHGSVAKLFTMFLSSPNQYLRKEIAAIRNAARGRISKKQLAKTIMIYHFILPMLFQWVSDRFTWDEDDDPDALLPFLPVDQKRAMILGPLNGIFLVGDGLDFVLRRALGEQAFSMEVPVLSWFKDLANAITAEDFLTALRSLAGAASTAPVGPQAGKPLKQLVDIGTGFSDLIAGEYEKGIAQIAGWSPSVAEKAAEEE